VKVLLAHNRYRYPGGEDEAFLQESELLRRAGHEVLEFKAHHSEIAERGKLVQAGLPSEKIFVKPNFLVADPGVKQKIGEYVLFVGRLAPEKGVRTLLEAFALLQKEIPLHIVGDGPLRNEVEAQRGCPGLSRLSFHGWLPREQTLEFMRGARFLIFPSEWPETFGLAEIEAFACGVPVIASKLDPITEIVASGKTGLHFTPGDANDLAAKVEWALTHANETEAMGRAARAEYLAKYSADRNYQLLVEIYCRVGKLAARRAA
jgi:glycosyltransferase involved in cell wall biosynthesis